LIATIDASPLRMIYHCCYESPLVSAAVAGRVVVSVAQDGCVRLLDLDSGLLLKTIERTSREVVHIVPLDDIRVVLGMTTGWGVLDVRNAKISDIGRSYVGFSYFGKIVLPERANAPGMAGYEGPPTWFDRRFVGEAQLDHERIVYLDEDDDGPPWNQIFRVWDFTRGREINWFKAAPVEARLLSAVDAHSIISGHADRAFRIWSVETGEVLFEMRHEHEAVHAMDVVHGRWLVFAAQYAGDRSASTGKQRFTINLWDLRTRRQVGQLYVPRKLISIVRANHGRLCTLNELGCLSLIALAA
jgi:WD40 repeat protein